MIGRGQLGGGAWMLIPIILILTAACQGTATPTPGEPSSHVPPLEILDAVTSRGVDGDYAPVDVISQFAPSDTFYCSVRVADAEQNTGIVARWYFGNAQISEEIYKTETSGAGYVAFELTNEQPWPEGPYRVEILSAGEVLHSLEFRVVR